MPRHAGLEQPRPRAVRKGWERGAGRAKGVYLHTCMSLMRPSWHNLAEHLQARLSCHKALDEVDTRQHAPGWSIMTMLLNMDAAQR